MRRRGIIILLIISVLAVNSGCVYFNTFYNTKKAFKDAEAMRQRSQRRGGSATAGGGQYRKAIEKSQKILDKYPNSSLYDDALYINGVSHFWTGEYSRAGKRFRELIANFPDSKYFKESRLYLAKAKLQLDDIDEAMQLFEELFSEGQERWIKAEAALALGEYFNEEKDYKSAEEYFQALIDSLGTEEDRVMAKMYIADGLFNRFMYNRSLSLYQEIMDDDISTKDRYRAMFRAGESSYFLNDIEGGMAYFNELAGDDLYYDSLPAVKLMIAQGYEWDGDLNLAEEVYDEVAVESPRSVHGSYANYMLGLIYQYEYEDYKKAKEYYDQAKAAGRNSDIFDDALERSANIGKLEEYLQANKDYASYDSASTQEEVDRAAETQYLLSELYLMELGKPDSALQEFQFILNNFPDSYLAPKTYIALALLHRDFFDDTLSFDSLLDQMLTEYPHSDFVPEALELKGLIGTKADTGYAALYYSRAEHFLYEDYNYDSAFYYLSYVADSFPYSELNEQARYARLWVNEEYNSPGDSTLYYAYVEFTDSFPGTPYSKEAAKKLSSKPRPKRDLFEEEMVGDSGYVYDDTATMEIVRADDTAVTGYTREERCSIGPDGETVWEVQEGPYKFEREFRFPPSAFALDLPEFFTLCFQIKIDPFGYVTDIRLVTPTESDDLNMEATETVQAAQFKTYWIRPEYADQWFLYKYPVELPQSLR